MGVVWRSRECQFPLTLRSRPDAKNAPIIVMTASGGPQEWKLLSSLGADRFLVKPVNLDDVVNTLRGAVRATYLRGACVYDRGRFGACPEGVLLRGAHA